MIMRECLLEKRKNGYMKFRLCHYSVVESPALIV